MRAMVPRFLPVRCDPILKQGSFGAKPNREKGPDTVSVSAAPAMRASPVADRHESADYN